MKTKLFSIMTYVEQRYHSIRKGRLFTDNRGFGMNELLSIAAALILAAFIVIPGLRTFAGNVMDGLSDWWHNTINGEIFPNT